MAGGGAAHTWHHPVYFLRFPEPWFFSCSDKFTRFCQWKNVELNIHVSGPGWVWGLGPRAGPGLGRSASLPASGVVAVGSMPGSPWGWLRQVSM